MNAKVCVPVCGDGILSTPMEECDDMNLQRSAQRPYIGPILPTPIKPKSDRGQAMDAAQIAKWRPGRDFPEPQLADFSKDL